MKFSCAHCGKTAVKPTGHIKRSRAIGLRLFCDRRCSGLGRRKHKSKAQRVKEKRIYDVAYRAKNLASIKAKKAAYFRKTYNPKKAAVERKKRMPLHVQYCRRPEYKRWKQDYDRQYRAREFGPFADAYLLAIDLNREVKGRMSNEQIRRENGTWAKRQARAREEGDRSIRDRHRATQGVGAA